MDRSEIIAIGVIRARTERLRAEWITHQETHQDEYNRLGALAGELDCLVELEFYLRDEIRIESSARTTHRAP
jgi:hypothetical protein